MMVGKKSVEHIDIPLQGPDGSVVASKAELKFTEDNELLTTTWTREANGQEGMSDLRYMRRLAPSERKREIENRCTTGDEADVLSAESSDIDAVSHEFTLNCEVEEFTDIDERIDGYQTPFAGPWIRAVPNLPEEERRHPIILQFPRYEESLITINSPDGFAPSKAPAAVDLTTTFGRYRLDFEQAAGGFTVTRQLALVQSAVPAELYGELREFFETIRRHDLSTVEFKREGTGG